MEGAFPFQDSLVRRSLLVTRLQLSRQARLTLLVAPAGYGKSTLLGQWLAEPAPAQPKVTLTIEEADNEPAHFLYRLQSGLQNALPQPDLLPSIDFSQASPAYPIALLFNKAAEITHQEWLLVLDDYHRLSAPSIHQAIDALLSLPNWPVHLVISSRQPPPLKAVARLRVENRLVEFDEHELQFTPAEITALFQSTGTPLTPSQVQQVARRTEGWATALRLICQASSHKQGSELSHWLEKTSSTGHLFDYLASQVLENQNNELRVFLRRTSLLPYLNPELCDAYLECTTSAELLHRLEQNHLFVIAFIEGNEQRLRYHSLFADFLRHNLEVEEGQAAVKAWHHRAATCLLQRAATFTPGRRQEAYSAAIEAYLAAGEQEFAADAIQTLAGWLDWSQLTLLAPGFERLSLEVLPSRPWLALAFGRLRERQCRWQEALAALALAERAFSEQQDQDALLQVHLHQSWVHFRQGNYTLAGELAQQALGCPFTPSIRSTQPTYLNQQAEIHLLLGNILFETGEFETAIHNDQQALQGFRQAGSKEDEARALSHLAYIYGNQGRLAEYIDSEQRALAIFDEIGSLRSCSSLVGLSDAYRQLGQYDLARQTADRALQLADAYQYPLLRGYALFLLGHWHREQNHLAQAREYYEEARKIGEELHEPCLLGEPRRGLALLAAAEGNLPEACRQARVAVQQMREIGYRELEGQALITLGDVLAQAGESKQSEVAYAEALPIITTLGDAFALTIFYLHQAELFRQEEHLPEALNSLGSALQLSKTYGYDTLFTLRERERSLSLLLLVLESQEKPTLQPYAEPLQAEALRLLGRTGQAAVEPLLALVTSLAPEAACLPALITMLGALGDERAIPVIAELEHHWPLKQVTQQALNTLHSAGTTPLQVCALGAFEVKRGNTPIPGTAWQQRRKTRLLLLYLLSHPRHIPRDELLEILWPDLEPESAGLALNTTFSDVRKLLEPYLAKGMPSHYLAHDSECYWIVPGCPIRYDAQEFEAALHQGETGAHNAMELYRGDLLPEEPYVDWVVRERERLLSLYMNLLMGMLESQLRQGAWHEGVELAQRILRQERWLEEVWRALITCYSLLGRRSEALQAYLTCERTLKEELGVTPAAETRALYEQLKV